MLSELNERMNKIKIDLKRDRRTPEKMAIKKGQLIQNTSNTENEKQVF